MTVSTFTASGSGQCRAASGNYLGFDKFNLSAVMLPATNDCFDLYCQGGFHQCRSKLPGVISSDNDKSHVCTSQTSDKWLFRSTGLVSAELEMRHARRQKFSPA